MTNLRGISKRYPGFTLGPLDLKIADGLVTGFVGANGAGKTTTIKTLLGMVLPDAGSVSRPAMTDIGVVLDTPSFDGAWKVSTVGKVLRPFYPKWSDTAFGKHLTRFGVPADRKVNQLSRGTAMKLQIAAALAHDATLLVLDEPTSGLDPLSRDELAEIVGEFMLDERHSVLFSSHLTGDVERIADYVAVIDQGQIVAYGERSELIDSYRLIRGGATPPTDGLVTSAYGLRTHSAGWDGLIPTQLLEHAPSDAVADLPTLDEIVVRIAKGR